MAQVAGAQVAYEHTGSGKNNTGGTSITPFAVTCDGSAGEKLVVGINQQAATTTVTYNGVSMTEVPTDSPQINNGYNLKMFTLDSPSSGSNNVAITFDSSIVANAVAACYSGSATGLDSHAGDNCGGSGCASVAKATTVVAANSWLVWVAGSNGGTATPTGATGQTRVAIGDTDTLALALGDSDGTVSTGSQSITVNSNAGVAFMNEIIVSIAPSGGGTPTCRGGLLLLGAGGCH